MNHPTISELLPWYVNGSLDIGERQAAALEATSCETCAKDVDDLTKLQAAVLELEAQAPEPTEAALVRALASVEEEERKRRLGHPWLGWWWALSPFRRAIVVSAALGAMVFAAIIVAPKPAPVTYDGLSTMPIALERIAPQRAAPNPSHPSFAAGKATLPAAARPAGALGIQLARTGDVSLLVSDVETSIASIAAVAQRERGVVLSLDDTTQQNESRRAARIEIAVPQDRFDDALVSVGRVGGVVSRSVNAENVGGQIVDAQARLRNLRHTEADYLRIMDRAGTIDAVLQVENQISATREQIEQLQGQVNDMQRRVALSAIDVQLQDEAAPASAEVSAGAQLRSTWNAALHSVKTFTIALLSALLWGVAYTPYVAGAVLVGGLALAGIRNSRQF